MLIYFHAISILIDCKCIYEPIGDYSYSSNDRADNPITHFEMDIVWKIFTYEFWNFLVENNLTFPFLLNYSVLKYIQIENSLLQTIVYLAKEGRILMRKTKEKGLNVTRTENAAPI